MAQPELSLQPVETLPGASWGGRALGGVFFALALVCAWFGFFNAAHAAGLAGKHGTLTVERCWVDRGTRRSHDTTVCGGTFRSDDGKVRDESASVRSELELGSRVPVQQAGDRYMRTGFGEVTRRFSLFFGGWIVVAIGLPFAATGMLPRNGVQAALIGRAISGTRAGTVRKWLFLGGLAGGAVCLYLTWIF